MIIGSIQRTWTIETQVNFYKFNTNYEDFCDAELEDGSKTHFNNTDAVSPVFSVNKTCENPSKFPV